MRSIRWLQMTSRPSTRDWDGQKWAGIGLLAGFFFPLVQLSLTPLLDRAMHSTNYRTQLIQCGLYIGFMPVNRAHLARSPVVSYFITPFF
jgi:hypothetical protein